MVEAHAVVQRGLAEGADGERPPEARQEELLQPWRVRGQGPGGQPVEPHQARRLLVAAAGERREAGQGLRHPRLGEHAVRLGHRRCESRPRSSGPRPAPAAPPRTPASRGPPARTGPGAARPARPAGPDPARRSPGRAPGRPDSSWWPRSRRTRFSRACSAAWAQAIGGALRADREGANDCMIRLIYKAFIISRDECTSRRTVFRQPVGSFGYTVGGVGFSYLPDFNGSMQHGPLLALLLAEP